MPDGSDNDTVPYLIPASLYPASSFVPSASFNSSWARLATVQDGNLSLYSMAYAATDAGGNVTFSSRQGAYNTTLANSLATHSVCSSNCSWNLPIAWTGAATIDALGRITVQGDAVAAVNTQLVAAISSGGSTQVFYSASAGSPGSWTSLTGSSPVSGTAPNITFQPCKGVLLTTLTTTNLIATTFPLSCPTYTAGGGGLGPNSPPAGPPSQPCIPGTRILCPTSSPYTSALPRAVSAWPIWTGAALGYPSTLGILAANASNHQIIFYHTIQLGGTYSVAPVAPYIATSGSAIFSTLGGTRLETSGGPAGLVSVGDLNATVFGLFTSRVQNRTLVEAVTSTNYGVSWGQSFIAAATVGSVNSPEVSVSPAGYLYATWAENGVGPWGVDSQEFAPSGQPLGNATELPGSATFANGGSEFPSVAVDGLQRALYTWTSTNQSGNLQIAATGGFPNDVAATQYLWQTLNGTQPEDFLHALPPNKYHPYLSSLGSNLTSALGFERSDSICSAETALVQEVYPYVTHDIVAPLQRASGACGTLTTFRGDVAYESGATTFNLSGAVLTQWALEALGFGVFATPDWPSLPPVGQTSASAPFSTPGAGTNGASWLRVTPVGVNPKTVLLNASSLATTYSSMTGRDLGPSATCGNLPLYHIWLNVSVVDSYSTVAWISNETAGPPYVTSYPIDSYFLTNLTPRTTGTWEYRLNGTYQETSTLSGWCARPGENGVLDRAWVISTSEVSISAGWPRWVLLSASGQYSTYFGYNPGDPWVNVTGVAGGYANVRVNWTNSLEGNSTSALADFTSHNHVGASGATLGFSVPEAWGFAHVPISHTLIVYENSTSYLGNTSNTWGYTDNTKLLTSNSAALTAAASCTLSPNPPSTQILWSTSNYLTNITGTSAVLTWYTNLTGTGWVHYMAANGSWLSAGAEEYVVGSYAYYQVTLHGLTPWDFYTAVVGVTMLAPSSTCEELYGSATWTFQTLAKFALTEHELGYDSISQQGGGAVIDWSLPTAFVGPATYSSGELLYHAVGNSTLVQVPLSTLPVSSDCAGCFSVNLSGLTLNTDYNVSIAYNFSYHGEAINGTSYPFTFWYEKDSSGDGLNDWEKVRGWEVTTTGLTGAVSNRNVSAVPGDYATNGLVSDFVEKEYGLDPTTLDTAGSHMLDTWNLTFDLGPGSPALPSSTFFHYFYENSSYNFSKVCQDYARSGSCPLPNRAGTFVSNLTAIRPTQTGDSTPWAASVRWSGTGTGTKNALSQFEALMALDYSGWLRATTGSYHGNRTITVWGKLSWGANPLAASTPKDGLADGARVNPLYDVGLEFHSVYANLSGEGTGTGYAVRIYDNFTNDAGQARSVDNWSDPAWVGNSSYPTISGYVTTLYATQTQQFQVLSLEVSENLTGWPQPAYINGTHTEVNLSYDIVRDQAMTLNVVGQQVGGYSTLFGIVQDVQMGAKTPTWLWVPTDNSTVNGLPVGLERYTGEQSFDLVVVNASSSVTSDLVPLPWGGYSSGITLSAGMNDLLIPREQFLESAFGQAVLLGRNTSFNASQLLPLISSTERSYLTGFNGSNLMIDLGAYWQNRVIAAGPGNITGSTETGTPVGNSLELQVMAAPTATSANSGGLPSNQYLYSNVGNPSALQCIVTLNISSTDTLDLLLAALLDNTTGGTNAVNGTFQSVTNQVGFLGLNPMLINAISNATEPSDGLYGPPASHFPPPPPPSGWAEFWNAVTSFVVNPIGTLLSLAHTFWNAATAAFTYFNHLAHEAAAVGAEVVARTAAAIDHIGQLILSALEQLLSWILTLVKDALSVVIEPINEAIRGYDSILSAAANSSVSEVASGHSVSLSNGSAVAQALGGDVVDLSLAVGVALSVVFTILTPFDLGADFVLPIVLTLVTVGATLVISAPSGEAYLTSIGVWATDGFANLTVTANKGASPQVDWKALAESVAIAATTTDLPLSIWLGSVEASSDEAQLMWPTIALVFDMIALATVWMAAAGHALPVAVIATVAAFIALLTSLLARTQLEDESLQPLILLDAGLGFVALGAALADLSLTLG